ncbi:SWR1-complex protein 4 [Myxozyma melibiosi]|uniref:SWR1-complex protein 4 n=1 Tax=Myxozyma melibiosi TaxID=54550 RepID=A0ABR1FD77_9ASCO
MASSADVRDMLDLPDRQEPSSRPPPAKRTKTEGKRFDGMNRELQNLLGDNTPAVTVIENRFKAKPNWKLKPTPWVWSKFKNSARSDDLEFSHWVRGTPSEDDYVFAKFNMPVDVPTYTEQEYEKCLADTAWTPRETAYLFDLCREYDLRWLVIQDRYEYQPEEKEPPSIRTLEDLKERYYFCCRKLMDLRREEGTMEWTPRELELYNAMSFNKDKEMARKQYLERLLSRSPAEVAEEERLILEYRKLQESSKKLVQERQDLLHLLESPQTSSSFAQFQSSQGLSQLAANILANDKNRRRKAVPESAEAAAQQPATQKGAPGHGSAHGNAGGHGQQPAHAHDAKASSSTQHNSPAAATTKVSKADLVQSATAKKVAKRVAPGEEHLYGISYHDRLTQGVFLRSSRVSTLKHTVQAKVQSVLAELSISSKLAMPTAKVCERYDALQQQITVLLDAKKQADKLEAEVKVLRAQKGGGQAE